jgi:TonB family protein
MEGVRIELEPEFKHLRFHGPDIVSVGQPIRRVVVERRTGQAIEPEALTLEAFAVKGSRGWRFIKVSPASTMWREGIRVGGAIQEPRKTKDARPRYPEIAKAARIQGVVILECRITPEGKIAAVRVLRGIPLLDDAAIEAVKQWEYTPTLIDGKPVPVIMTITVNFRLS